MGNRWTPRKGLLRRFGQVHGHLGDVHNYLEQIKEAHAGRETEQDLITFLTVMQNRLAELDMLNDAALHRFKTGAFWEFDSADPAAGSKTGNEGDLAGPPLGAGEAVYDADDDLASDPALG